MTVLDTTPEQEAQMIEFLADPNSGFPEGGTNPRGPKAQLMVRENCAQAACNTLSAAGLVEPDAADVFGGGASTPAQLQKVVQGLASSIGTVVFRPDEQSKKLMESMFGKRGAEDEK